MNIWFIPIRSWSKSIPWKNIRLFCGKPLIYRSAKALQESDSVDQFYVALDDDHYERIIRSFNFDKLHIYRRDQGNADDFASTESVMLEFLHKHSFWEEDLFFLVQATNPFLLSNDLDSAYQLLKNQNKDSCVSCSTIKRFIWSSDGNPQNYNIHNRPRRQDFDGLLVENGAFYINTVKNILRDKNRLSWDILVHEMLEYAFTEIDEEADWIVAENIFRRNNLHQIEKKPTNSTNIKIFLTDVDGVLTDGSMYYSESGDELKRFHTYDGKAFEILRNNNLKTWIITQENTKIVANRAKKLKIDYLYQGITNKLAILDEICEKEWISYDEVAYVWDDIGDKEILERVWFAACPQNAIKEIKDIPNIFISDQIWGSWLLRFILSYLLMHNFNIKCKK